MNKLKKWTRRNRIKTGVIVLTAYTLILMLTIDVAQAKKNNCEGVSKLAGVIMKSRQMGIDMADVIKVSNGDELFKMIIVEAYGEPLFSTDKHQKKAITEFSNFWYLACLKSERDD